MTKTKKNRPRRAAAQSKRKTALARHARERHALAARAAAAKEQRRLEGAVRIWQGLSSADQSCLAREAAETRAQELRLAHRDLLAVGYGYRTVGKKGRTVTTESCVAFFVRRKWTATEAKVPTRRKDALPKHLYSYWLVDEVRQLCAIPTDVEGGQHYAKVRAHANGLVRASSASVSEGVSGMICCAVQYQAAGPVYGLGCHHVLAMSDIVSDIPAGVRIDNRDAPSANIGRLSTFYGIVDPNRVFFDAALATISNANALGLSVVEPVAGTLPVLQQDGLSTFCSIHTFLSGTVDAQLTKVWIDDPEDLIPYPALNEKYGKLRPKVVVEVHMTRGQTQKGDSGSPVFDSAGGFFQGMYIAGDPEALKGFYIPAYELLRAQNYGLSSGEEMLTLAFSPFRNRRSGGLDCLSRRIQCCSLQQIPMELPRL